MIDISDGIGSDLRHIIKESKVCIEVNLPDIPLSEELLCFCRRYGLDPYRFAAAGGEDYELLFTITPKAEASLELKHNVIGCVKEGDGLEWRESEQDYMGFRHF